MEGSLNVSITLENLKKRIDKFKIPKKRMGSEAVVEVRGRDRASVVPEPKRGSRRRHISRYEAHHKKMAQEKKDSGALCRFVDRDSGFKLPPPAAEEMALCTLTTTTSQLNNHPEEMARAGKFLSIIIHFAKK